MVFKKFIVEDGSLIIASCTFHKDLALNVQDVKGGGIWGFDSGSKTFVLSGKSFEFGAVPIEDIKKCIKNDKVFRNPRRKNSIATKFNFVFNHYGNLTTLSEL